MPKPGPICPYCTLPSVLRDQGDVYGPRYAGRGNLWVCCNYPDCDAYVGVSTGPEPIPTGTLANAELRRLRKRLRSHYDEELQSLETIRGSGAREARQKARILRGQISKVGLMTETQIRDMLMARHVPLFDDERMQ